MALVTVNTADAKEEFSELINRVSHYKERVILTRRDKEIAAIVPIEDLHLLQSLQDKRDLEEATTALKEARKEGAVTLEALKDEIG